MTLASNRTDSGRRLDDVDEKTISSTRQPAGSNVRARTVSPSGPLYLTCAVPLSRLARGRLLKVRPSRTATRLANWVR